VREPTSCAPVLLEVVETRTVELAQTSGDGPAQDRERWAEEAPNALMAEADLRSARRMRQDAAELRDQSKGYQPK
jgi:hypothetical protein